jgi:hypothetical protein
MPDMNKLFLAAAALAVTVPVAVASPAQAQSRYRVELRDCNAQVHAMNRHARWFNDLRQCRMALRQTARRDSRWGGHDAYNHYDQRWQSYDYNRYEPGYRTYDPTRYYVTGSNYRPYTVTRRDRIYRGNDGNYYCRRSDGSTGLIAGAAIGGLLGNSIGRGDSRVLSTIIGAGAGAALGSSIDRGQVVCR